MISDLQSTIAKYNWYHRIELAPGVVTPGSPMFDGICSFIACNTADFEYTGKSVLDVGCRDCLHGLRAEWKGAARVVAIDSDISAGARDLVLPHLRSKIELRHQNLYTIEEQDAFDIVQFFGVLYHLRYPFSGIKKLVDATKVGGLILVEGGFLVRPDLANMELLYCPRPEKSPYEPSSVTFFNEAGLDAAFASMGCVSVRPPTYRECSGLIRRGFFAYEKREKIRHSYWEFDGLHTYHTRAAHAAIDWRPDSLTAAPAGTAIPQA